MAEVGFPGSAIGGLVDVVVGAINPTGEAAPGSPPRIPSTVDKLFSFGDLFGVGRRTELQRQFEAYQSFQPVAVSESGQQLGPTGRVLSQLPTVAPPSAIRTPAPVFRAAPQQQQPQPQQTQTGGTSWPDFIVDMLDRYGFGILAYLCAWGIIPRNWCTWGQQQQQQQPTTVNVSFGGFPQTVTPFSTGGGGGGAAGGRGLSLLQTSDGGRTMPNVWSVIGQVGLGALGGLLTDVFGSETPSGGGVTIPMPGSGGSPLSLPGGAPVPGGNGNGMMASCPPARPTMASLVPVTNPCTGRLTFYRNVGRPILFSGDMATCKRVKKVGRRARSAAGGR